MSNEQKLIDAGWFKIDEDIWQPPGERNKDWFIDGTDEQIKHGGICLSDALNIQAIIEKWGKENG